MQIDHPQTDQPKDKCRNPNCDCDVEAGHPYCSEHCRTAAEFAGADDDETVSTRCDCGHETCTGMQ